MNGNAVIFIVDVVEINAAYSQCSILEYYHPMIGFRI